MFEIWKQAWRDAVENFRRELHGDDADDPTVDRLNSMRRDYSAAVDALRKLERELDRTLDRIAEEHDAAAACSRRHNMALRAGHQETAAVAARFSQRHQQRAAVLQQKAEALEAEQDILKRELAEMKLAITALDGGTCGHQGEKVTGGP